MSDTKPLSFPTLFTGHPDGIYREISLEQVRTWFTKETPAALLRASASAPPEKEEAALAEERTAPSYHCERCQMALPERLMTFGIGVRGGDAAWCAACKPPAGEDGAAKRAEVIALRKAL